LCGGSALEAADKSGVGPNSISVPKGPGSIEGLGESFQPSLNSGTANYGIALVLPPGTGGQIPTLRLGYEGGGGNGPLGFGWELGIPSIQRRSDKGVPLYPGEPPPTLEDDWTDRYHSFLEMKKEELVPLANGDYFGRVESAFVRYRRRGTAWEGTQPDGSRLEFGLTENGRVQADPDRVFSWLLERDTDTHGNTITYAYTSFADPRNHNQKYLREIRYGPGAPPWDSFHFVVFVYEDRPDWIEDCRAGFPVRTGKRLRSIVIGTQGPDLPGHLAGDFNHDGVPDHLNRRYDLEYLNYAGAETHWSLLAQVTLVGADGVTSLPPATHDYSVSHPPDVLSAAGRVIGGVNEPPVVMDHPSVDFADLNADGSPDLLRTYPGGGAHQAFLNQGETEVDGTRVIRWSAATPVEGDPLAWNYNLESTTEIAHLNDLDGDGLADLVYRSGLGEVYFFANLAPCRWGDRQKMSVSDSVPPSPFGLPGVKTADLDFDKRMDVVQSLDTGGGADYRIWFNLGNGAYARSVTVPQPTGWHLATPGVHIADCNGDRVPDIVRVRATALTVTAGYGYGRFGEPVLIDLPDTTLDAAQLARASMSDVTGDGLPDLVLERAAPGELWYWINLGNYTFSRRKTLTDLPTVTSDQTVIRWVDINGNGTTDLVYADSASEPHLQAVDLGRLLNVESGPNILTVISNGIGGVTLIGYLPSTHFAIADAAAGSPWPDRMPLPVQVVSAITNLDSLGHQYVTRFRYHDGYYDPVEKQFRGFARAEQIDVGEPEAPTLVTRSHFDTGRTWRAMKGKLLRLTTEQEDGKVFTDETTQWIDPPVTLMIGTDGESVTYAHPVASVKRIVELGQGEERRLESGFAYDRYGNETTNANYGVVVGGDPSAFDDERVTTRQYAVNTNAWVLRLPARVEIMDEHGVVISRVESFYDDETFSGSNLGEIRSGNLTLKREWVVPADPTNFVAAARSRYDSYGNPTNLLDALARAPDGLVDFAYGHVRSVQYDDAFHAYGVAETVHVGDGKEALVFQATYDAGHGVVSATVDFNGNPTAYGHDAFGRPIHILRPGDLAGYPSVEYAYAVAVPLGDGRVVNHVETRQLDRPPGTAGGNKADHYAISRQFTDGLGRTLMTKAEAEPATAGGSPRVVVSGAVQFNAREKPARLLNPFFTALASDRLDELLAYEPIEAPGWYGWFQDRTTLVARGLQDAHQTGTRYDATLREVETRNADGTLRQKVYGPLLARSYDENDVDPASPFQDTPTLQHTDGLGRLIQIDQVTRLRDDGIPDEAAALWTTRYAYDLNDQLVRITDSQQNTRTFAYDALKRRTRIDDPDRGRLTYEYDAASNLRQTLDAKGQTVRYTYDGANRMLTKDYLDEASPFSFHRRFDPSQPLSVTNQPDVAFFYDTPVPQLELGDGTTATAANTRGRLASVIDLAGEEHLSYDPWGRDSYEVKRVPDPITGALVSYTTRFRYDPQGRITVLTYPDNDLVRYEYNARGLVSRIYGEVVGDLVRQVTYSPAGQITECRYGNGVATSFAFDSRLRLAALASVRVTDPEEPLIALAYDLDAASNIDAIRDERPAAASPAGTPGRNTQQFRYDDLYRLLRVQYSFHAPGQAERNDGEIDYRYDRVGNLLAQTSTLTHHVEKGLPVANLGDMESGGTLGRWNRSGRLPEDAPGPHALSRIRNPEFGIRDYSYDANGNLTTFDGLSNAWDFENRLVAVSSPQVTARYTYDYTDRRVLKRVDPGGAPGSQASIPDNSTITYVNRFFEVREHDQRVKYIFNGDTRVARMTGTLSAVPDRVQRYRVQAGWNLFSISVEAADAVTQFGIGAGGPVTDCFRWAEATRDWRPVTPGDPLPAGSVFWLRAASNATLQVAGRYVSPTNFLIPAEGVFCPAAGLQAVALSNAAPPSARVMIYDPGNRRWRVRHAGEPLPESDLPAFLPPGSAIFVALTNASELVQPAVGSDVAYYHQDHLGSSTVIADETGSVVRRTCYYPFGWPRHDERPALTPATVTPGYGFVQKERDDESGLMYFEARYYHPVLGRFASADPLSSRSTDVEDWAYSFRDLNVYAYAGNNPLRIGDPEGLLTIIVPGTWNTHKSWEDSQFRQEVSKSFGEPVQVLGNDNMGNTKEARSQAARDLVSLIKNHAFEPGEKLNIVAHSHGGNVAFEASRLLGESPLHALSNRKIDVLVTMGTPIRPDYTPRDAQVRKLINVFSKHDPVQVRGGGESRSILTSWPFKAAAREVRLTPAENVDASIWARGLGAHSQLWQSTAAWRLEVHKRLPSTPKEAE
jgi:RHS repeat-associated protein